ncbi:MAG: sigma-70 family RNA polymerase sigma factor [Verrucomicrobiota bacterium]
MPDRTVHTSATLLFRLRDPADNESWSQFADIYCPLLYDYCRRRGLAHPDRADVVQEVMRSVSLAMRGFEYDPKKGAFKSWLYTALRNAISDHFRKSARRPVTALDENSVQRLEETPDESEFANWDRDYEVRLLSWAMEKVKPDFGEKAWRAFELTALRGLDPADAAKELGTTKNAVTMAKFRIVKRLRETTAGIDPEQWEQAMARKGTIS